MKILLKCLNVHGDQGVYISITEHVCYIYVRSHEHYVALLFAPYYYYFGATAIVRGWEKKRISYGAPNASEVAI